MNRRLVRIYKDPKGNGDYVNKTKAFLQKAQMGAETQSAPNVNAYLQYIYEQLKNEAEPDDVLADLVSNGLNEDAAYQLLSNVVDQMLESGEMNPDNPVTNQQRQKESEEQEKAAEQQQEQPQEEEAADPATDYFNSYADEPEYSQPDLEFQEGGEADDYDEYDDADKSAILSQYTTDNNLNNTDESNMQDSENADFDNESSNVSKYGFLNQQAQYPGLHDYYEDFTPLSWEPVDTSIYRKGGSKKTFAKNVLKKLQEGGQEQQTKDNSIGQGNKFDTLTSDVSKIKNNFINAIKETANKAKLDETYDKMMNSGDQSLIASAQALSQSQNESQQEESFFQSGGYVGENEPYMFMYGGAELPFYEADFLPEAQNGAEVRTAKVNYVPNPVLRSNERLRLFNAPFGKRKTYSNMPYNALTKEVYKDPLSGLTPYARTVYKKGIFGKPKRWTDWYTEGSNPSLTPGQEIKEAYEKAIKKDETKNEKTKDDNNKWGYTEEEWDEMSGSERRAERRGQRRLKRQMARGEKMDAKEKLSPAEEYFLKKEKEEELRKKQELILAESFAERYNEEMGINDPNSAYWDNFREEQVETPLVDGVTDEDFEMIDAANLDAEKTLMQPDEEIQKQAMDRLNAYNADKSADIDAAKVRDKAYNQFASLRDFIPDKKAFEAYELKRKPLEEAYNAELQGRELEEEMQNQEYEKQYGGILGKYQIQGAVKSPTSTLSRGSDPTANTVDLTSTLKPAENPNTLLGMSLPFMNQNVPVNKEPGNEKPIIMDPNQMKGPDDKKKTLYAQDFEKRRDFDGIALNNTINTAGNFTANIFNKIDKARQDREMYENNFSADSVYGASSNKDRGDYVAYGQQTGMFRPDQTGNDTLGRFAYGQRGGYMQDGGQSFDPSQLEEKKSKRTMQIGYSNPPTYMVYDENGNLIFSSKDEAEARKVLNSGESTPQNFQYGGYTEGDEVDMTEEELQEFLANGGEVEYIQS